MNQFSLLEGLRPTETEVQLPARYPAFASRLLQHIRNLIEREHLEPGTKLPPERVLAAQLKVGRPAVREAIKALSMLDILESRRGDGTYIKSLEGFQVGGMLKTGVTEPDFDMIELLEVRKMFEPRAAGLAAARATGKQLKEIEEELLIQEAHPDSHTLLELHDYRFHDAIILAAENEILNEIARVLAPHLIKSRQFTARTTPDISRVVRQHRTIFEAIRIGESELAEQAMREHLQTVGLDLISERRR